MKANFLNAICKGSDENFQEKQTFLFTKYFSKVIEAHSKLCSSLDLSLLLAFNG
jgi:hypothetical protein